MHFSILKLRPTQMALGLLEVKVKAKKYSKMGKKRLRKEIKKDPISCVAAPNGDYFIVDGHHRAMALWLIGEKKIFIVLLKDFSKSDLSYSEFWGEMNKRKWTHVYDQFGGGPHEPVYLPEDIRGLGDDPYRSLAWLVAEEGGFKKTKDPYENFLWANFFRKHRLLHCHFERNFKSAKKQGLKLAMSRSARPLPGSLVKA